MANQSLTTAHGVFGSESFALPQVYALSQVIVIYFLFFIQFLCTITQGKHRAMLYISKGFKTEQKQNEYKHKLNNNIKRFG